MRLSALTASLGLALVLAVPGIAAASPSFHLAQVSATYTVVLGETLWGISRRFGLPLGNLIALNRDQVADPDLIRVGQILRLAPHRPEITATKPPAPRVASRKTGSKKPAQKPPTVKPPTVTQPQSADPRAYLSSLARDVLARHRRSILGSLPVQQLAGNRLGAAKRGSCAAAGQKLVALLPDTNLGQTVSDQPTFFWRMPALKPEWQSRALRTRFRLTAVDSQGLDIDPPLYQSEFDSGPPGIASLTLPVAIPTGENLRWTLSILCDPDDPDGNEYVKGWIRRVEASPQLAAELEKANLVDYPALYARAGLWFDALKYLSALRRKVSDASLDDDWAALLDQVQLGDVAKQPLTCRQDPAQTQGTCATVSPAPTHTPDNAQLPER